MITGEVEVTIDRSAEEIFDFIADPRSELVWNPTAKAVTKLSQGANSLGSRFRGSYKGAGSFDIEVTEFEPPRRTSSRGDSKLFGYELHDEFTEIAPGRTQVRRSMSGVFKGPMSLIEPLIAGTFKKRFAQSATRIKEALEAGRDAELPKD